MYQFGWDRDYKFPIEGGDELILNEETIAIEYLLVLQLKQLNV